MTNKYFIHLNKLYELYTFRVQFYPDRFTSNYELHLQFNALASPNRKTYTYTFNSIEDVLASLGTLNFNTLQHYQTNHPELFI